MKKANQAEKAPTQNTHQGRPTAVLDGGLDEFAPQTPDRLPLEGWIGVCVWASLCDG
jgi:hypothetical protein